VGSTSACSGTCSTPSAKSKGGGLPGLIQAFQANGLGDVVSSWIGTGPNQPISASQIQSVLGSDAVKQLAARMGISPDAMSARLADVLPGAIDTLTPDGKLPEGGLLAQALSALRTKVS
jgi:uncharacterized protein YidB (DUF937 family)